MVDVSSQFDLYPLPDDAANIRVHVLPAEKSALLEDFIIQEMQSCYIAQELLEERVDVTGCSKSEILETLLPNSGNIMSGDFGEILTLYFLASEQPEALEKIKKWRYKVEKNRASPFTDVVILHREFDNNISNNDFVIAAESKAKATRNNATAPLKNAIEGALKDRISRLAVTLVWLKEKLILSGTPEEITFIKRFTDDALHKTYNKIFKAVAIVDRALIDEELVKELEIPEHDDFEVIALAIPNLRDLYRRCFKRVVDEADNG